MSERTCLECGRTFPVENFLREIPAFKAGYYYSLRCAECSKIREELNHFKRHGLKLREILIIAGAKCAECGSIEELDIDHIAPIYQGGAIRDIRNMHVLCGRCHKRKTATERKPFKIPVQFSRAS